MQSKVDSSFHRVSVGLAASILYNMVLHKISRRVFLKPILPSFFVTTRCNLKCSYCRIIKFPLKELTTADTMRILEKIRPGNQALSITGGEPTVRKDIIPVLKKARELDFKPIFFNTNGLLLDRMESILLYVDYLIISLDTLNHEKWDAILGVRNASGRIIRNIRTYAALQKAHGFRMVINPVITSGNIGDIYEIIKFCKEIGVMVSPVPEDDWKNPEANLLENKDYHRLINDLLAFKQNGGRHIVVTRQFLEQVRDFAAHDCLPTLVPRIYPDGSVFYPCTPCEKVYGNILDYASLNALLREAHGREGLPACAYGGRHCFMSCFMEPANMVDRPLRMLREQLRSVGR